MNKDFKRPASASRRIRNSGYSEAGASYSKRALKGFHAHSGSPVDDINENNYTLRQRSRMLYMASPIATSAIHTNRTNVIGVGLQLKSRIDRNVLQMTDEEADAWQHQIEREFNLWAMRKQNCDDIGVNNFYEMQQVALTCWLMSGDVFALINRVKPRNMCPYSLRIHLIEADRISTPSTSHVYPGISTTGRAANGNKILDGVEVDSNGMIQAYHIRNTYPESFNFANQDAQTKWQRVRAYGSKTGLPNILHIMESERADQYRGVPYLAHVIEPVLQIRRYTEAEVTAAIIESFFTAFIKTESDAGQMPFNETGPDNISADPNEYEMGPGTINVMKPGEDITFGDPKRPASGFVNFERALCEQIGAALEVPADLLLKSFNNTYSSSRAALLEAWKAFHMRRTWFANDFCDPIYEMFVAEAVARGRINAPGFFTDPIIRAAYLGCDWVGPSQGQLDPVKEMNAEVMAISHGLTTHEAAATRLNGSQFDRNIEQLIQENKKLREARDELGYGSGFANGGGDNNANVQKQESDEGDSGDEDS